MDRGIARRPLFQNQADRRRYLGLLAGQVDEGRLIVHCFALMENHVHLFVESPNGDLSTPMREIKREYARRYNRVLERDGALFRSRFYSKFVHDEEYRRAVLEYIDLNAVKAGLASHPCDYDHSSAALFARGREHVPSWLSTDWVSAVVEERVGVAGLPPGAYRSLYLVTDDPTSVELVEARLGVRAILDPRAQWSRSSAEQRERFIADWLRQRAELADGPGEWLPLTSAERVLAAVAAARALRGPWARAGKGPSLDLWSVLVVGLLLHVAGLSVADCVTTLGLPRGAVRGRAARHLELLRSDAEYRQRMVDVTALVTAPRRIHRLARSRQTPHSRERLATARPREPARASPSSRGRSDDTTRAECGTAQATASSSARMLRESPMDTVRP
jgi:REP element-mobilizing transposase RayT